MGWHINTSDTLHWSVQRKQKMYVYLEVTWSGYCYLYSHTFSFCKYFTCNYCNCGKKKMFNVLYVHCTYLYYTHAVLQILNTLLFIESNTDDRPRSDRIWFLKKYFHRFYKFWNHLYVLMQIFWLGNYMYWGLKINSTLSKSYVLVCRWSPWFYVFFFQRVIPFVPIRVRLYQICTLWPLQEHWPLLRALL